MKTPRSSSGPLLRGGIAAMGLWASACTTPPPPPPADWSTVRVAPFAVEGPGEGADFVGRALGEALARELEPVGGLRVLGATAPGTDADATLGGTLRREPDRACLEVEARAPRHDRPVWVVVRCSATASLSDLVGDAARECVERLGRAPPPRYPYVGRVEGGVGMRSSPLLAEARERLRSYDFDGFAIAAERLVERFPDEPDAHVLRAWASTLAWDGAPSAEGLAALGERLERVRRLDPASPYPDLMQAYVYRASGAPDESRQLYSRVLARDDLAPSARSWALRQRSYVDAQVGRGEAARQDAEESVRLDPANAANLIASSRALEAVGEFEAALARATDALALEPRPWRHLQRAGIAAMRAGADGPAIEFLRRACDGSRNQESCANLAIALHRTGRSEEALRVASEAEALPPSPWGSYNLACVWALRGGSEAAIDALRRASDLGYADVAVMSDPDLNNVRGHPRFAQEVERILGRIRTRREMAEAVFPWQS